ncbi:unnamed protein product [Allacma fusca]|uniref:Uncharacterized protein n=1 Tax=Allacma fusca TaxID=39272 RepID=A0A8J2LE48_9HEXA|nr:unnamed protein product [Allacma fusca]
MVLKFKLDTGVTRSERERLTLSYNNSIHLNKKMSSTSINLFNVSLVKSTNQLDQYYVLTFMAIYKCGQYEDAFDPKKLRNWQPTTEESNRNTAEQVTIRGKSIQAKNEYYVYPVLKANADFHPKNTVSSKNLDIKRPENHHKSQGRKESTTDHSHQPTKTLSLKKPHAESSSKILEDPILARIRLYHVPIIWIIDDKIAEWYERELLQSPTKYWQIVNTERQKNQTPTSAQVTILPPKRGAQIKVRAKLTDSLQLLCSSYDRKAKHLLKRGVTSFSSKATANAGLFDLKKLGEIHIDTRDPLKREKVMDILKYAMIEHLSGSTAGLIIDGSFTDRMDYIKFKQMFYAPMVGLYFTESHVNKEMSKYINTASTLSDRRKVVRSAVEETEKIIKSKVSIVKPRNFHRIHDYSFIEVHHLCEEFKDRIVRVVNAEHLNKSTIRFINSLVRAHLKLNADNGREDAQGNSQEPKTESIFQQPRNKFKNLSSILSELSFTNSKIELLKLLQDEAPSGGFLSGNRSNEKSLASQPPHQSTNDKHDYPQTSSPSASAHIQLQPPPLPARHAQPQPPPIPAKNEHALAAKDLNSFHTAPRSPGPEPVLNAVSLPKLFTNLPTLTPKKFHEKNSQQKIDLGFEKIKLKNLPIIWIYGYKQTAIGQQRLNCCRFLAKYFDFTFLEMDQQILYWHKYILKNYWSGSPEPENLHDLIFYRAKEFERKIYPAALGIYLCSAQRYKNARLEPKVDRPKYFLRGPHYSENSVEGICQEFRHKTIKVVNVEDLKDDGIEEICQLVSKHLRKFGAHSHSHKNSKCTKINATKKADKSTQPEIIIIKHTSLPTNLSVHHHTTTAMHQDGQKRPLFAATKKDMEKKVSNQAKTKKAPEKKTISVGVNVNVIPREFYKTLNAAKIKLITIPTNSGKQNQKSVVKLWETNKTESIQSVEEVDSLSAPVPLEAIFDDDSVDPENYAIPKKVYSNPNAYGYEFLGNFVDANKVNFQVASGGRARSYWKFADYILEPQGNYMDPPAMNYGDKKQNMDERQKLNIIEAPDRLPAGVVSIPQVSLPSTVYETANSSEDDFEDDDGDDDAEASASKTSTLQGKIFGADGRKSKGGLITPDSKMRLLQVESQKSALRAMMNDDESGSSDSSDLTSKPSANKKSAKGADKTKNTKKSVKRESIWATILKTLRLNKKNS